MANKLKLRSCPFCKSNNVRVFNIVRKPIEIVCNDCHSIFPNIVVEEQTVAKIIKENDNG